MCPGDGGSVGSVGIVGEGSARIGGPSWTEGSWAPPSISCSTNSWSELTSFPVSVGIIGHQIAYPSRSDLRLSLTAFGVKKYAVCLT